MGRATDEAILRSHNTAKAKRREQKIVTWDGDAEAKAKVEREQWRFDCEGFLVNVMPKSFPLAFSQSHKDMIRKAQNIVLNGGRSADAMPRGSGKTTIAQGVFLWAILYGHKRYGAVIGNEADAADNILESIKTEIWLGDGIGKYFPKLQAYIQRGDGQSQKFRHLLNQDESPPMVKWSGNTMRLPSTPEAEGDEWSGAILQSCGITGKIRGMFVKLPGGTILRPDFVIVDDPQTRESAKSLSQINDRENTIAGDIMGLGGPNVQISAFMMTTVIYPNDLSCRFLDPTLHPEWFGSRVKMIEAWPDEKDGLWQDYGMLRKKAFREKRLPDDATAFYVEHREAMDAGAVVYWPERVFAGDVSALQHAMNLWLDSPNAFMAEYQNDPAIDTGGAPYIIDPIDVMDKVNGMPRLVVPDDAQIIASMTDINFSGLNTVVLGSTNNAIRFVVDHQTYPGNGVPLYDPKNTMAKSNNDQLAIARALDKHIPEIASARYVRNGKAVCPDLVLIDCGNWMDLVFRWCEANRHRFSCRLYPSRGRGYTKYKPTGLVGQPGDGFHVADWEKRGRVLVHNSDLWRMRAQKAFLLPAGVEGGCSLFGKTPTVHKQFADEVCAEVLEEYIEETSGGNQFFKYGRRVGVSNDKLDALVGAFVGSAYLGASETGLRKAIGGGVKKQKRKVRRVRALGI
jgi:hypothetical protein